MRHLLFLLLICAASCAVAQTRPELSVAINQFNYRSFRRSTPSRYALELSVLQPVRIGRAVPEFGGGLRTAHAPRAAVVPLEAFGQARFAAAIGPWRPAAGLELGLSGFTELPRYVGYPNDDRSYEQRRLYAPYVAFNTAALRFRASERWTLSALELQLGATLVHPGAAFRLQLGLLRVGGTL